MGAVDAARVAQLLESAPLDHRAHAEVDEPAGVEQPGAIAGARHLVGDRHAGDVADRVVGGLAAGRRLARAEHGEQTLDALGIGGVGAVEHERVARQRRQLGRRLTRVAVARQGARADRFQNHPDDRPAARDPRQLARRRRRRRLVVAPARGRRQRGPRRPAGRKPARGRGLRQRQHGVPVKARGLAAPDRDRTERQQHDDGQRDRSRTARARGDARAHPAREGEPARQQRQRQARRWARSRSGRPNRPARSRSRAGGRMSAASTAGALSGRWPRSRWRARRTRTRSPARPVAPAGPEARCRSAPRTRRTTLPGEGPR